LVATVLYFPTDKLALNLAGKKGFAGVTKRRFASFAQKARLSERETLLMVEKAADATITAWESPKSSLPMDREMVRTIDRHLQRSAHQLMSQLCSSLTA
jgi:hypothetical protein